MSRISGNKKPLYKIDNSKNKYFLSNNPTKKSQYLKIKRVDKN